MFSKFSNTERSICFSDGDTAVLVPEEVPTILGIIYSLIPPVKIGKLFILGTIFKLNSDEILKIIRNENTIITMTMTNYND